MPLINYFLKWQMENYQLRSKQSAQNPDSQGYIEQTRMNRPEIRQLSQSIQQMSEKRSQREDSFSKIESLLNPNKFQFATDFNQDEKWRTIGMNFNSDDDSDEDLESGLKFAADPERHAKKTPPMHLQFASTRDRQLETNRVSLPQRGQDSHIQIYSKPQQSLISGKHPKMTVVSSPTMGTSQQLREIFESTSKDKSKTIDKPKTTDKFSFQSKAQALEKLDTTFQMQREINELINSHVKAEPIRVQQYHPPSPHTSEEGTITTSASGFPSASSRDAKLTFHGNLQEQKQPQQQQATKPAVVVKKTLAHFFESQSKYISVRAFHQQNDYMSDRLNELKGDKEVNKDSSRYKILKHWFKELNLSEMSIVLTTVDKELIRLIRAMYKTQMKFQSSGKFIAKLDQCSSPTEADRYEKVPGYNLLFVRDRSNFSHSNQQLHSQSIQKRAQSSDWLLKSLRFISVKTQEESEEKDEAINSFTLDQESYQHPDFFLQLMKNIDPEFFMRQFTCTKLSQPIEGSLLTGQPEQVPVARPGNQKKSSKNAPVTQKAYFLVQDSQRRVFNAASEVETTYHRSDRGSKQESESCIDLAQMVLLIIEKGINIHFMDFLDQVSNVQQSFFFFKMSDFSSDLFSDDLKVANYWFNLPFDQKSKQLEELDVIGNDLLRILNDSKQQFDNIKEIEEEENSSHRSDTDSNDSDDFNCLEPKLKGRKKIGALNPRAQIITEYSEYEQARLPIETMIVEKKRRRRKDRIRGPNGSEQTSSSGAPLTSSSGQQVETYTYCDYNPNQLRAQYSGVVEKEDETDDYWTGNRRKNQTKSFYECMGDMVIDPVPSEDENDLLDGNTSDFDPENLRPYSSNTTTYGASFDYRNFPGLQRVKDQEETKLPAFIQSKPKPRIHVGLPTDFAETEKPRNDLMGANQPSNRIFLIKQEIKTLGLKNGTFKECLQFVKMLSTCKDIDTFVKESDTALSRQPKTKQLKIEELRPVLRSRFFQKLSKICTDSILADLLAPSDSKGKKKKPSDSKPSVVEDKNKTLIQPVAAAVPEKKKNKKKAKKKKKKVDESMKTEDAVAEQAKEPTVAPKEKLSDAPSDYLDAGEQDSIQNIAAELGKYTESASGPEVMVPGKSVPQSCDDSVTSSQVDRMQHWEETTKTQEAVLMQLYDKLERINTVESILNDNGCPDICDDILAGKPVPEAEEINSDSDDNNEAIQKMLNSIPGNNVRESENELRFKEERTGLLSNQIHLDKYKTETLHELKLIENQRNCTSWQKLEMIDYVLRSQHIPPGEQLVKSQLKAELTDGDIVMQQINHYQKLIGSERNLPTLMSQRQKEVVLRILQEEYKQKQQSQQSGGGPEETKAEPVKKPEDQVEDAKKKGKKKNKKNRRGHKQVESTKPTPKPEVKQPQVDELIVDDVEEVILPEDSTARAIKLDKSVLRNNFLTEDEPVKSSRQQVTSAVVIDPEEEAEKGAEKQEAQDREDYVQSITNKLIQTAVQSYAESPSQSQMPARVSKQQRKKGKGKATQEMQFQQKAKPTETAKTTMSGLSQLSSDAASNGGKGVPVYCATPILTNQKPPSVVSFKADLSDNVKIPKRGTSDSSYGKEEKFHEQTLLELDSLFPSGKKGSSSGSSFKVRSSTLSKDRLSSRGLETANRLINIEIDDVQSQKIDKKSKPEQPSSPLLSKMVKNDAKVSLKIEERVESEVKEEQKLTKAQKKSRRKQQQRQEQERAETVKKEADQVQTVAEVKKEETGTDRQKEAQRSQPAKRSEASAEMTDYSRQANDVSEQLLANQRKDAKSGKQHHVQSQKNVGPQWLPKTQGAAPQQPSRQQAAQKTAPASKQKVNPETSKSEIKHEIKPEPRSEPVKPEHSKDTKADAKDSKTKGNLQKFTDFDSMFESVYGARAISGIIVQSDIRNRCDGAQPQNTAPTKQATEPEADRKKGKPDQKQVPGKKAIKGYNEIKVEEPDKKADEEQSKMKNPVEEEKKGRGVQARVDNPKASKTEPSDLVIVHSDQQKTVQTGKSMHKHQYSVSSVQTPSAQRSQITSTTVIKHQAQFQSTVSHETTTSKRNRGAQYPPTPLGNSVTNSVPTVASNGSQTVNLQQISTQQQQTQYTVNLNIVNHTNQFMSPLQQQAYLTPQQLQQQQLYMQMMQQQMLHQQQFGMQPMFYGYPNHMVRPQTTVISDEQKEESNSAIKEGQSESLQQLKMNPKTNSETATITPQRQAFQLPPQMPLPLVYTRPMMPMQYPQYQKPVYFQQNPSFFQVSQLYSRMQVALNDNVHMRLSDQDSQQITCRFLKELGKQVHKIVGKIETRLAQIEEYKEITFSRIQQLAKQTFNDNIEFEIYGSMATKLAIDTSDMDIAIYGVISAEKMASSQNPRDLMVGAMEQLSLRLQPIDWIVSNRVIGTASVPVIKLEIDTDKLAKTLSSSSDRSETIKQFKIDIIFNDFALPRSKDADGLEVSEVHTKRAAEYVKQQIGSHPFLRPLVIVLKKYLSLKNLNNSFMGTVSSYGLVLMLIALLEDMKRSEPILERQQGEMFDFQLGKALAQFFYVFGECFQTQYCMINEKNEFMEPEDTIGQLNTNGTYVLQVIDPCNEVNNVGKQTYKFDEVQEHLCVTFECLLARYREFYNLETKSIDLMRRKQEIDRALRYSQVQFPSVKPEDETKDMDQGSLFDDYNGIGGLQSQIWLANPMYLQASLVSRGQTQLKADLKEATDLVDKFTRERQDTMQSLFDRILMINSDDLKALMQDEEEEHQHIMIQLRKAARLFSSGFDQGQSDMYPATDIQELLTGQQQPQIMQAPTSMYPYQQPYYQGYMQQPGYSSKPYYMREEGLQYQPKAQPQHQKPPEEGKRPKKKDTDKKA